MAFVQGFFIILSILRFVVAENALNIGNSIFINEEIQMHTTF